MAVVTTTFSIPANTNWASTTWAVTDPSYKLHLQLTDFVNAINDPSKISILMNPGNATSRSTSSFVPWVLQMREGDTGNGDYGILFKGRNAGTANTSTSSLHGTYYARSTSTSNNGYGTFTNIVTAVGNETFTSDGTVFIAYEATGSTPWFIYVWENSARSARYANALFRCDTSGMDVGSYYPSSGLGKWIYAYSSGGAWYTNTPQASILAPYKGINSGSGTMRHPTPNGTYGTNYFFKFASQYGDSHYLGNVTQDMLTSNTNTGQFGDTTTINGINYTCMGNFGSSTNLWVKTS
jgi:hypothetical protein